MSSLPNFLARVWTSDELLAVVVAFVLSTLFAIGAYMLRARSRVGWSVSHQHAFNVQSLNPPVLAFTREIWVQNVGREIAEGVEVVLSFKPQHFDVWPQRPYEEIQSPDGSFAIRFDHLNHREWVTISLLQIAMEPPSANNVRWRGGVAGRFVLTPQQLQPRWKILTFLALMLIGFFSLWYFAIRIIF